MWEHRLSFTFNGHEGEQVSLLSVHRAGNALREDFTFRHTFSSEVSKLLKASPGQIVILQPEKFRSKYEPASHMLSVKVISICLLKVFTIFFLFAVRLSKTSCSPKTSDLDNTETYKLVCLYKIWTKQINI